MDDSNFMAKLMEAIRRNNGGKVPKPKRTYSDNKGYIIHQMRKKGKQTNYQSYHDTIQDKANEYLEGFIEVSDIEKIPCDTLVRYITLDKQTNKRVFRLGGKLCRVNEKTVMLSNPVQAGKCWYVARYHYASRDDEEPSFTTRFFIKEGPEVKLARMIQKIYDDITIVKETLKLPFDSTDDDMEKDLEFFLGPMNEEDEDIDDTDEKENKLDDDIEVYSNNDNNNDLNEDTTSTIESESNDNIPIPKKNNSKTKYSTKKSPKTKK
jgi:hypothetical protein